MPTINQRIRLKTKKKVKNKKTILNGCPQKSGTCTLVTTTSPRKPNSAQRKIAKVKLSNGKEITAYIRGEGHSLKEHSKVLVQGGKVADLPGVRYRIVAGARDHTGVAKRKTSRSLYGTSRKNLTGS